MERRFLDFLVQVVGLLTCALVILSVSVPALGSGGERGEMPSEREARWPFYQGERVIHEQVVVKELRTQEDRLYLNDEPFVLTNQTSIVDEWGQRIVLKDIPLGSVIAIRYRTGPPSEARGHGTQDRVVVQIQVVEWPKRKIRSP